MNTQTSEAGWNELKQIWQEMYAYYLNLFVVYFMMMFIPTDRRIIERQRVLYWEVCAENP
jgi:hypothetical protein